MIPSREHFLLKRRSALSMLSFSPTLIVDIFNPPSPQHLILAYYNKRAGGCQIIPPAFCKLFLIFVFLHPLPQKFVRFLYFPQFSVIARVILDKHIARKSRIRKAGKELVEGEHAPPRQTHFPLARHVAHVHVRNAPRHCVEIFPPIIARKARLLDIEEPV